MSGDFMQGDPDNSVAVPFSDDESDEPDKLLEEDTPTASPEERQKNKERRQARIARLLNEGKQSKAERDQLKSEQASLREELAELRGRVAQSIAVASAGAPPSKDAYDLELDRVYEMQVEAYNAVQAEIKAGTWNADRQKHYEKIARDVETQKSRIHTRRELDATRQSQRAEQAQQVWVQKYPEVYGDPRAYQYAEATFRRKQALLGQGERVTNDLVDEVMTETMNTFKLGKRSPPSANERAKHTGIAATGGGSPGGGNGAIPMTPQLRRMAIARYSELPEAEAIKKWVDNDGKRMRAKKLI